MGPSPLQDFCRNAHFVRRIGPGHFPSEKAIQELVVAGGSLGNRGSLSERGLSNGSQRSQQDVRGTRYAECQGVSDTHRKIVEITRDTAGLHSEAPRLALGRFA
jgi:hypothetical protein